jgi:hypothetical protein
MHPCFEKLADFASGAIVPGKLIIDDRRFDKVEGNKRYFNPVIVTMDIGSYALAGGLGLMAYSTDSPLIYGASLAVLAMRGALGVRTNSDRRTFENHHRVSLEEIPVEANRQAIVSRMLPGR